jgi:hypothetical protein
MAWAMTSLNERATVPPHVLVRFLEDEAVLLNTKTERYFGLDGTATQMWREMTASPNLEAAFERLLKVYDVDAETLRRDFVKLLAHLTENGLLNTSPSAPNVEITSTL